MVALPEFAVEGAFVAAAGVAATAGTEPDAAWLAFVSPRRGSPLTARLRMASRRAVSEGSPSLVPGVWARRPRHVKRRISKVVFTVIYCGGNPGLLLGLVELAAVPALAGVVEVGFLR